MAALQALGFLQQLHILFEGTRHAVRHNYMGKFGVIAEFEACVEPMMLRIRENLLKSQTLSSLRDTLLPRLISGQLRLPEAQSLIAEGT